MFHIYRNGQLTNIDNPANRTTYIPNVVPACCACCGLSWLADVKWARVGGKLVCEQCKKGEADNV